MTSLATLLDLPDDASVPMRIVRPHLVRAHEASTRRWIRAGEARGIMGVVAAASTVRGWARRWWHMQEQGLMPEVRVMRAQDTEGSHWLFDYEDCWTYRRTHGGGPREHTSEGAEPPVAAPGESADPDEVVADFWASRVTRNMR